MIQDVFLNVCKTYKEEKLMLIANQEVFESCVQLQFQTEQKGTFNNREDVLIRFVDSV